MTQRAMSPPTGSSPGADEKKLKEKTEVQSLQKSGQIEPLFKIHFAILNCAQGTVV